MDGQIGEARRISGCRIPQCPKHLTDHLPLELTINLKDRLGSFYNPRYGLLDPFLEFGRDNFSLFSARVAMGTDFQGLYNVPRRRK
jgi:hypothetical protein